ncbi:Sec-independent protein translocase subunit TatA/TatB [Desulfitobacterium sp.]|uniref:Sec-independent protein translocase subunit TatA/TatB n=1 Tax=Desulfitobacterium sp. TaxID=49981 RepID=UPI002B1EAFA6|nr:twin-arginine translocase TatA/TatE family subunit [Desulfitobacterium sp.]MEA4902587.1 twin-arginine translocase TatA/TatE family subunit [Desulfitobacterium sp.]
MGFSMSELLVLMVIGLIIFGPDDLPDIARTVGKFVYEVKKMFNDASKDFKEATKDITKVIDEPANVISKTLEETVKPVTDLNNIISSKQNNTVKESEAKEELHTYDEVEKSPSETIAEDQIIEDQDPLAGLPEDMVSYKVEK